MEIKILKLLDGAKQATGLTVFIDVFRAFSTACYVFNNNANKIIPVGDINLAYKLKKENPEYILMGERNMIKPSKFDYGNSPALIEDIDFSKKIVVHTTSAGTQGLVNAKNAEEIITGSFVNLNAIKDFIIKRNPQVVSLVALGEAGVHIRDEDVLCAQYIKNELEGVKNDFSKIVQHLRGYISARRFFEKDFVWAPEKDFHLCLAIDKFNFVLKVEKDISGMMYLKKISID